jgi:hypothetical protein
MYFIFIAEKREWIETDLTTYRAYEGRKLEG